MINSMKNAAITLINEGLNLPQQSWIWRQHQSDPQKVSYPFLVPHLHRAQYRIESRRKRPLRSILIGLAFFSFIAAPALAVDVRFADTEKTCWEGWCLIDCHWFCSWIKLNTINEDIIHYSSTSLHPTSREERYSPVYEYEVDCKRKVLRPIGKKEWTVPVRSSGSEAHLDFLCSDDYEYDIINIKSKRY